MDFRGYTSSVSPYGLPPSPQGEGFGATPNGDLFLHQIQSTAVFAAVFGG